MAPTAVSSAFFVKFFLMHYFPLSIFFVIQCVDTALLAGGQMEEPQNIEEAV